jgi:superfamily II DNA or RNA helicase
MPGFVCEERLTFGPWPALERMLARLIEHAGFSDVSIVGGAGDNGADVVGTHNGIRWVLQAKYRSSGGADSEGARDAVRAMTAYKASVAAAATNTVFTPDAYQYYKTCKSNGLDVRLWNGAYLLNYYQKLPDYSNAARALRNYQLEAVESIENRRASGARTALLVMATGLGKSVVANQLIANELGRNPEQEVLVLAHTRDLVRQLERGSWSQLPKQHATHLWTDGEEPSFNGGVVFATWQSVFAAYKRGEPIEGRFGLIVVDEAHHAPSGSFRELLHALRPNFLIGMTATPWRGDERRVEEVFGPITFSMDIVDGMQQGYLAEVDYRMLTDGIDWVEVALKSEQGLTVKDLNVFLLMPDRDIAMIDLIASKMVEVDNPRVIGFCRSIEHASRLQPLLAAKGIRAALLHSGLTREERFHNLSAFRLGEIQMLLSVEMLNEGIDVPDVNIIAFMRVTHSRRIFVQQLGRGLRLSAGKERVLVLDFVADIRRLAAGLQLNREAAERAKGKEVFRYSDGRIVQFDNDNAASFFKEYLADVADLENYEDGARLKYPESSLYSDNILQGN